MLVRPCDKWIEALATTAKATFGRLNGDRRSGLDRRSNAGAQGSPKTAEPQKPLGFRKLRLLRAIRFRL